jgi:predicted membrane metal-binding protein
MQVAQTDVNPTFNSPLLVVAASFALGILCARLGRLTLAGASLLLAGAGACLLTGLVALRADWRRACSLLAVSGFILAGAAAAALFEFRFAQNHIRYLEAWGVGASSTVQLQGVVLNTPLRTPYGDQFDLEARRVLRHGEARSVTGKIRLRLAPAGDEDSAETAANLHLQYGDSIGAPVQLRRPRVYRNPGGFDYARYLESIEDLSWEGTISSPALVEKLPTTPLAERHYDPVNLLLAMRHRLLHTI